MTHKEILAMTEGLLKEHGVTGYVVNFWGDGWVYAQCNWDRRMISFNSTIGESCGIDQIRNTALHEIAHALVVQRGGEAWHYVNKGWTCHHEGWVKIARELGCTDIDRHK